MPRPIAITDLASAQGVFAGLATRCREFVGVAYLDPNRMILGLRHGGGGVSMASVSIRQIAREALGFRARGIVMAHNHPSGDATPSARDVAFTVALARTMRAIEVDVLDHIVLAGDRVESLRARGVL